VVKKNCRAVIISAEEQVREQMEKALLQVNPFLSVFSVNLTSTGVEVEGILAREFLSLVFIDMSDFDLGVEVIQQIRRINKQTQIVAFSVWVGSEELLRLMRLGIKEWVQIPAREAPLQDLFHRIQQDLEALPAAPPDYGHLVSFIPAKPGSGASTVAMHAAHACANSTGARLALLDLDLNCGIQGFLAKADGGLTVQEATQYADKMDSTLWDRIVIPNSGVDLLRAGKATPGNRIDRAQFQRLLNYMELRYPLTFVDLSGNWEGYSVDALERSSVIFLVCTTDLASLHQAHRNMELFEDMGIRGRVQVILNRAAYHNGLDKQAVETILGMKPIASLPNAFVHLQKAMKDGTRVAPESAFGLAVNRLVQEILKDSRGAGAPKEDGGAKAGPFWKMNALRSAIDAFRTRSNREDSSNSLSIQ
jgi:pilus assembly protein CpaE